MVELFAVKKHPDADGLYVEVCALISRSFRTYLRICSKLT
jgi:hypothetical protein